MPFPAPVFSEPTYAQHYVQISYTNCHPNWTLNMEITDWKAFTTPDKVGLSLWQLYYTLYYSFNSKSDIKGKKCGETLFTLLSKVFTAPIFTEVTNAERHCVKTSCYKFYPYWSSDMESSVGSSFLSLSKLWVPLSQCHKINTCKQFFCMQLLYWIIWKSGRQFCHWN